MNTVVTVVGALIFFALIMLSVGLHELGHFIPAKIFKVKVTQFFLGFGKNIWKTKKGETEYGVKILPLGGYVRMLGMYPPKKEGKNTRLEGIAGSARVGEWEMYPSKKAAISAWLQRIADSAREAEWEEITREDVDGKKLYFQKPLWQRLIVMFGGVLMNILLAFGLFLGVNLAYGIPQSTTTMAAVWECADSQATICPTPAAAMGMKAGDTIVAINGTEYATWDELAVAIRDNGANPIQISVIRDGQRIELPRVDGMLNPNNPNQSVDNGFLGVTAGTQLVKVGVGGTIKQMWDYTVPAVVAIVNLPVSAFDMVVGMIKGEPRDTQGPISIVGASRIAGDVAALDAPAGPRLAFYVQLLASVNLFVGLINLVPLPPFDGGHIAAGAFEGVRRWWRKLFGKPDPGPADTAKLLPITYFMFVLLCVIGAIFIIADIVSPVTLS